MKLIIIALLISTPVFAKKKIDYSALQAWANTWSQPAAPAPSPDNNNCQLIPVYSISSGQVIRYTVRCQ